MGPTDTQFVFATPGNVGDLMVVGVAITYAPTQNGTLACPVGAQVVPPAGWDTLLPDSPQGENDLGDLGGGAECDRLAIFTKVREAGDGIGFVFTFGGAGAVSAAAFVKVFPQVVPGTPPEVDVAAPAVLITTSPGSPMDVDAPSIVTVSDATVLMVVFVSRWPFQGTGPAPSQWTVPAGMTGVDFPPSFAGGQVETQGAGTAGLGIGVFVETLAVAGATGVRTSQCSQAPEQPLRGMGYSLAISGGGGGGGGGSVGPLEIYTRFH